MNFVPPTSKHLVVFSVLLLGGMLDLVSYELFNPENFSLTSFLSNSVSILLLSAGWSIPIAEGAMFVEHYFEERRQRFLKEGREEEKQTLIKKIEEISDTEFSKERVLQKLKQD